MGTDPSQITSSSVWADGSGNPALDQAFITLNEDHELQVTLAGADLDDDPASLNYQITALPDPLHGVLLDGDAATGTPIDAATVSLPYALASEVATFVPTPNYHGGSAF